MKTKGKHSAESPTKVYLVKFKDEKGRRDYGWLARHQLASSVLERVSEYVNQVAWRKATRVLNIRPITKHQKTLEANCSFCFYMKFPERGERVSPSRFPLGSTLPLMPGIVRMPTFTYCEESLSGIADYGGLVPTPFFTEITLPLLHSAWVHRLLEPNPSVTKA